MKWLFFILAILFLPMATFAYQLGLDNNQEWGKGRIILLIAGLASLTIGTVIHFWGAKVTSNVNKALSAINKSFSRTSQITIASFFAAAITITIYSWVLQLDQKMIQRVEKQDYDYYSELAKGFKGGHLYIKDVPPPELLALDNPYDYFLRKELGVENFPWDVSLYKGRFYLYWGPAPAILLLLFSDDYLSNIADFHLVFVFISGTFIYLALLITTFWHKSLTQPPAWLLFFLLVVVGLSTPALIMLRDGRIYEAAISGGQFFFIGGCYWAYASMLSDKPNLWKLALSSTHLGLAVCTRFTILPIAIICACLTLIFILRVFEYKSAPFLFSAMILPLTLIGCALAWYNWARFGSIFEFGTTYQLTNMDYANFTGSFSFSRIVENAKIYLLHPLQITNKFPYINRIEYLHSSERMGGLLYLTPYMLLLPLIIPHIIRTLLRSKKIFRSGTSSELAETWLLFTASGSWIISFTMIMSFWFITMRYMEDFMPVLLILITTQIGINYDKFSKKLNQRKFLVLAIILLGAITIFANLLITIPPSGLKSVSTFFNLVSNIIGWNIR